MSIPQTTRNAVRGTKYRSRLQITYEILYSLKNAQNGSLRKSRLMYNCFLSSSTYPKYVDLLRRDGLINYDRKNGLISLTDKGYTYIMQYDQLAELVPDVKTIDR